MPEKVIMPKVDMTMETGVICHWLKNEGDKVEQGEVILEIETDKLAMELEAEVDGVLLKRLYEAGDVVPVLTTIAWIGSPGEAIPEDEGPPNTVEKQDRPSDQESGSSSAKPLVAAAVGGKIAATPAARRLAGERGINLAEVSPTGSAGEIRKADVEAVRATPLARRVAESQGINLCGTIGTGPGGKIYSTDFVKVATPPKSPAVSSFAPLQRKRSPVERETLRGRRKIIAERMSLSHQTVPAATLRIEVDADPIWRFRMEYNSVHNAKITFNDLVLKATALALDEFPELNASLQREEVTFNDSVHLGVAMAVDRGLLVPVVRHANELSLRTISDTVRDLTVRAKSNSLKPGDLDGATFTVTNLGMFDIVSFTPIINLPQVTILGVCAIVEVPVVRDGSVVPGRRMGLCLTHDHRWIDGALGALFLKRIKQLLEHPLSLLH